MRHIFFAAIAALAAVIAMPAMTITPAAAQEQAADFTDAELQSFADAVITVRAIGQTYQPKLEAAETEAAKEAVREEATAEMTEAIKDEGVTVERYTQIATAARSDPELASRISDIIQERQQQ